MKFLILFILLTIVHGFDERKTSGRIFDGSEAPEHGFPWMAAIYLYDPAPQFNRTYHVCGGSIVSDIYVITAASCFFNVHQNLFYLFSVKAGIHKSFNGSEETEQIRSVSRIVVHPNYNNATYLNDLALVRVSTAFNLKGLHVQTVSLSNLPSVEGMDLVTIGWGLYNRSNLTVAATSLQQVTVQEDVQCAENKMINSTTQLCATGTCTRDSGGPLMIYSNASEKFELVAVTSFRNDCATEGVFTRVAPFANWIWSIVNESTTTIRTTTARITGPPIPFVCDTKYPCGCSPTPVIFHDEPSSFHRRNQGRIVGGETAQPHSWPWVVSIRVAVFHSCGGSIINSEWILTAAHCVFLDRATIHVGVHNVLAPTLQIRNVTRVIKHPDFVPAPKHINDIALLHLSSPINLATSDHHAGVTCLPSQSTDLNFPMVGTRLAVIGWGVLADGGDLPNELQQVRVNTLAHDDPRCIRATYDRERQFCAMVDGGGKDACQGDSGGPIHQWLNDHWEQVGIVSFGASCADENSPGVYTRLSVYRSWILETITDTALTTTTITTTATATTRTTVTTTTSSSMANICKSKIFYISIILCIASFLAN